MSELLTRAWRRDPEACRIVSSLSGSLWAVRAGELESITARVFSEIEHMSATDIRAAYAAHRDEQRKAGEDIAVRDGVATIPIRGLMMREPPSVFSWLGLATSTSVIRQQIKLADDREDVRAILLLIDSPGGEVSGTDALAQAVSRTSKMTRAHASDLAASAAIWVASQADLFTVGATAAIGSIGVYTVIDDTSKLFEGQGIKSHLVSSGGVKGGLEQGIKISEEALAEVQQRIDAIADLFIDAVAEGRGKSADEIRKLATGSVWVGKQSVANGIADAVMNDDDAFSDLRLEASIGAPLAAAPPPAPSRPRPSKSVVAARKEILKLERELASVPNYISGPRERYSASQRRDIESRLTKSRAYLSLIDPQAPTAPAPVDRQLNLQLPKGATMSTKTEPTYKFHDLDPHARADIEMEAGAKADELIKQEMRSSGLSLLAAMEKVKAEHPELARFME